MRNGLKIYGCSGLGSVEPQEYTYWRDNTIATNNTKAVNNLLALINTELSTLRYAENLTTDAIQDCLNKIDLYCVCYVCAQDYKGEELLRCGRIIGKMWADDMFSYNSLDNDARDKNLDNLIDHADLSFTAGENPMVENEFTAWFNKEVATQDYVGFSEEERKAAADFYNRQKGVSGTQQQDATDYLYNAGGYYLYLYMDEKTAKQQGSIIYLKWLKEREVYEYIHKCYDNMYSSPAYVDSIIYSGICEQYKHTPEYVISTLLSTKKPKGVGEPISAAMITAIAALISAIVAAIGLVVDFVVSILRAKYEAPSEVVSGTPEDYDWGDIAGNNPSATTPWIKYGLIGAAAFLVYNLFKK